MQAGGIVGVRASRFVAMLGQMEIAGDVSKLLNWWGLGSFGIESSWLWLASPSYQGFLRCFHGVMSE